MTDRRFEQAKPILDRYRDAVAKFGKRAHIAPMEPELRELWRLGYQELKDVLIDLSRRPEYTHLAALYMEDCPPGAVSEFHDRLAELYGVRHYHADDREEKQRAFWEAAFGQGGAEASES